MNIDAYNLPRPSVLARKKLDDEIKALKESIEMLQKANKYGIEAWRLAHLLGPSHGPAQYGETVPEDWDSTEHNTKEGGKENE